MSFNAADLKRRMEGALESFAGELQGLRTGRATTAMLDTVTVEAYGSRMPLNQCGSVTVPEPRLLNVQVTQPGEVLPQDVPAGAVQYRLDGDLKLDIWYDAQRGWVKTRFAASDGSVVDYRLQE